MKQDLSAEPVAGGGASRFFRWLVWELRCFLTAQSFLTRIPCPQWVGYSDELASRSPRYYPLVGLVVGSIAFGFYLGGALFFSVPIAVLLSMVASVLLTGAFHEDGLADSCDGFGGGWGREQILGIMKDSRIGTYGTVGLVLMLALKFECLRQLGSKVSLMNLGLMFLAGHGLSRFFAIVFIRTHTYAQSDGPSKSRAVVGKLRATDLFIPLLTASLPMAVLAWTWTVEVLFLVLPLAIAWWQLGRMFTARLGGYTGDCLGAAQQVFEAIVYLSLCGIVGRV